MAGNDFVREIPVELPETMASHDVLAPLWARARIDDLMGQDYTGAQMGSMHAELKDTITQLGIEYPVDDAVYFVRRGRGDDRDRWWPAATNRCAG